MALNVGDKLTSITLPGTLKGETKQYDLGENQGKRKVLIFYPFAFTPN